MIHFRIVGSIWLISGLVSAVKFPFELWSMATDQQYGITTGFYGALFWISKFLVEVSFLLILLIGWGLLRLRRWAAVGGRFLGVISLLVCLWFILTQGTEHGPEPYVVIVALPSQRTHFLPYGGSEPTTESPNPYHRMAGPRRLVQMPTPLRGRPRCFV